MDSENPGRGSAAFADPRTLDGEFDDAVLAAPDLAAFASFYVDHAGFVWSCVRRLGVPLDSLEDAVQDIFITAFRRLDSYMGRASERAWLYGIARRVASRYRRSLLRRSRKHVAYEQFRAQAGFSGGPMASDMGERLSSRALIESGLACLDDDKRAVFLLSELHGMSAPEVADALEVPVTTVESRLKAARKRFRQYLVETGVLEHPGDPNLSTILGEARASERPEPEVVTRGWLLLLPQLSLPLLSSAPAVAAGASVGVSLEAKSLLGAAVVGCSLLTSVGNQAHHGVEAAYDESNAQFDQFEVAPDDSAVDSALRVTGPGFGPAAGSVAGAILGHGSRYLDGFESSETARRIALAGGGAAERTGELEGAEGSRSRSTLGPYAGIVAARGVGSAGLDSASGGTRVSEILGSSALATEAWNAAAGMGSTGMSRSNPLGHAPMTALDPSAWDMFAGGHASTGSGLMGMHGVSDALASHAHWHQQAGQSTQAAQASAAHAEGSAAAGPPQGSGAGKPSRASSVFGLDGGEGSGFGGDGDHDGSQLPSNDPNPSQCDAPKSGSSLPSGWAMCGSAMDRAAPTSRRPVMAIVDGNDLILQGALLGQTTFVDAPLAQWMPSEAVVRRARIRSHGSHLVLVADWVARGMVRGGVALALIDYSGNVLAGYGAAEHNVVGLFLGAEGRLAVTLQPGRPELEYGQRTHTTTRPATDVLRGTETRLMRPDGWSQTIRGFRALAAPDARGSLPGLVSAEHAADTSSRDLPVESSSVLAWADMSSGVMSVQPDGGQIGHAWHVERGALLTRISSQGDVALELHRAGDPKAGSDQPGPGRLLVDEWSGRDIFDLSLIALHSEGWGLLKFGGDAGLWRVGSALNTPTLDYWPLASFLRPMDLQLPDEELPPVAPEPPSEVGDPESAPLPIGEAGVSAQAELVPPRPPGWGGSRRMRAHIDEAGCFAPTIDAAGRLVVPFQGYQGLAFYAQAEDDDRWQVMGRSLGAVSSAEVSAAGGLVVLQAREALSETCRRPAWIESSDVPTRPGLQVIDTWGDTILSDARVDLEVSTAGHGDCIALLDRASSRVEVVDFAPMPDPTAAAAEGDVDYCNGALQKSPHRAGSSVDELGTQRATIPVSDPLLLVWL